MTYRFIWKSTQVYHPKNLFIDWVFGWHKMFTSQIEHSRTRRIVVQVHLRNYFYKKIDIFAMVHCDPEIKFKILQEVFGLKSKLFTVQKSGKIYDDRKHAWDIIGQKAYLHKLTPTFVDGDYFRKNLYRQWARTFMVG